MPFNVASIKDRAVSAKNATVTKIQDTRDRHSSTPMARTRFADSGFAPDTRTGPPPPPPARRSYNSSVHSRDTSVDEEHPHSSRTSMSPPPPVARSTKPNVSVGTKPNNASPSPPPPPPGRVSSVLERAKAFGAGTSLNPVPPVPVPRSQRESAIRQDTALDIDRIDWANLSLEDKQVFFSWLDEFFARLIEQKRGGGKGAVRVEEHVEPAPAPPISNATARIFTNAKDGPGVRGPPPVLKSWSKPKIDTTTSSSDFTPSYPPPTTHGSQALDLAHYFHPSTIWDTPWYAEHGAPPPPLLTNPHRLYKAEMMHRGDAHSVSFAVLFCDLSAAWVSVEFSGRTKEVQHRTARYLPVPSPLGRKALVEAHEIYGEAIASFAESFLGSGQFCARGECWDLASEALKSFSSEPTYPPPVLSLGRTHGHLIFAGRAFPDGRQMGCWRGGDDRVRRGDIVEWRTVRIGLIDSPRGSYATLGDPEHTAVITRDSIPSTSVSVYDGASIEPRALGSLEVVEQSLNQPPEPLKRCYDLEGFEEGEVWIYRPVSMEVYLGFGELQCTTPDRALSI